MFDTRELCDHSHIGRGNSCTYGRDKFSYTVFDFKAVHETEQLVLRD
jgi:hypothetical protein